MLKCSLGGSEKWCYKNYLRALQIKELEDVRNIMSHAINCDLKKLVRDKLINQCFRKLIQARV